MDGPTLHTIAMRAASGLPSATRTQPFGPEYEVFKVVGKIFAMTTAVRGKEIVTVKCEPPYGAELAHDYDEINPGYHMNKRHWISITPGERINEILVEDLVFNAYDLVVAGLPRIRRPTDLGRDTHLRG